MLRDAGGPVTLVSLGPKGITPTFPMVTSPQGARDVLGGADDTIDKEMIVHGQSRICWAAGPTDDLDFGDRTVIGNKIVC